MDTSDDEDMLMRKLAIYEFGFRNILQLMLESLSIFRLCLTIFYYEIVKTNTLLRKLKQIKKPSSVTVLTLSFAVLFHNNKQFLNYYFL